MASYFEQLVVFLIGLVHQMVGNLGRCGSTWRLDSVFFLELQLVNFCGTTALVARAWGAKNYVEAANVTSVSLWMSNAVGLVLMIPCLIFSYEIASVFGLSQAPTRLAADYIWWLSFFNLVFSINLIISAALRAVGDVKTPLWVGTITNLINVLLLYFLVGGNWVFPELGVVGAAIASGVSFTVGTMILIYLYYGNKVVLPVLKSILTKGVSDS